MSRSIAVDILSDDDDAIATPLAIQSKRHKTDPKSNPTVFVIDDDPTPRKPTTPLFVPETPNSDVAIVKCTTRVSDPHLASSSSNSDHKISGICGLICLESDNDSEYSFGKENWKQNGDVASDAAEDSELNSRFINSSFSLRDVNSAQMCGGTSLDPVCSEDVNPQVHHHPHIEIDRMEPADNVFKQKGRRKANPNKQKNVDVAIGKKRMTKDERIQLKEERKQQKEKQKLHNAALKAEAVEMKKLQKEQQNWEKGKHALRSIVAEIDAKVVELGSVGGPLLTSFAEKGISFRITKNPIERSIMWTMTVPEKISQLSSSEIPYILLVYEAEEFCNLVMNDSLIDHISCVQSRYQSHTICYLTNQLMAYIKKRDQGQYKNPENYSSWTRPPVEEVLSKITTHFVRVHSRQCRDVAELAEHVVGLTCSLASCQFRNKLSRLSVHANGSFIPNDGIDNNITRKSFWLKALLAIPKVQPRFAIAIWKKYPTMKSLLSIYMNPSKSVHEKEFLLKDLTTEGLLRENRRLGEICSKRVYRILMAQSGNIKTDDIEDGADFFNPQST